MKYIMFNYECFESLIFQSYDRYVVEISLRKIYFKMSDDEKMKVSIWNGYERVMSIDTEFHLVKWKIHEYEDTLKDLRTINDTSW